MTDQNNYLHWINADLPQITCSGILPNQKTTDHVFPLDITEGLVSGLMARVTNAITGWGRVDSRQNNRLQATWSRPIVSIKRTHIKTISSEYLPDYGALPRVSSILLDSAMAYLVNPNTKRMIIIIMLINIQAKRFQCLRHFHKGQVTLLLWALVNDVTSN